MLLNTETFEVYQVARGPGNVSEITNKLIVTMLSPINYQTLFLVLFCPYDDIHRNETRFWQLLIYYILFT